MDYNFYTYTEYPGKETYLQEGWRKLTGKLALEKKRNTISKRYKQEPLMRFLKEERKKEEGCE
jgi:hypothetical protein